MKLSESQSFLKGIVCIVCIGEESFFMICSVMNRGTVIIRKSGLLQMSGL